MSHFGIFGYKNFPRTQFSQKMRSLFEIRSYLENSTGKRSIAMLPYITTNSLSRKVLVLIATKFLSVNGSYSLPEPHKLYTDDASKGRRCQNMVASNPYSSWVTWHGAHDRRSKPQLSASHFFFMFLPVFTFAPNASFTSLVNIIHTIFYYRRLL